MSWTLYMKSRHFFVYRSKINEICDMPEQIKIITTARALRKREEGSASYFVSFPSCYYYYIE
jgi:hypothetical protein